MQIFINNFDGRILTLMLNENDMTDLIYEKIKSSSSNFTDFYIKSRGKIINM